MKVVTTAAELAAMGRTGTRAVVMTMGALHEGHLALVRAAAQAADEVVVTVFVNPLQFDDPEDLDRYPRDLDADCALLEAEGVDLVYAPDVDDVYPAGAPLVTVAAGPIGEVFEGEHRPGHFDGVLTIVLKLLMLTRPNIAVFGHKDAQQLIAVRTMVRDLNIPVQIVRAPTVREADGLALSSRNIHLSDDERREALALSQALHAADAVARAGGAVQEVLAEGQRVLDAAAGVTTDYFAALDPASAQPVASDYRGEIVIAVAARVGATRLIDNVHSRIGGPHDL
jgi:pantoate--beta-alanine ligase